MLIRSQNRNILRYFEQSDYLDVSGNWIDGKYVVLITFNDDMIAGEYSSKEKARKVLDAIEYIFTNSAPTDRVVYLMPKDEEV